MMRYCLLVLLILLAGMDAVVAQSPASVPATDATLTHTIDRDLKEIMTIQVGMTRTELLRVFTTEGGLSTRDEQQFVYRRCPYIKVIVKFRRPDDADVDWGDAPDAQWGGDLIASISKPFLEYSIAD